MKFRNSMFTRILALCLAAFMITGMLPVFALATSAPPTETKAAQSEAPSPLADVTFTIEGTSEKNLFPGDTCDLAALKTLTVAPAEQAGNYELRYTFETEDTSYALNGSILTAGSAGAVYTVTYAVYDISGSEAVLVEDAPTAVCVINVQAQTGGNHTNLDTDNAYLTSFTVSVTDGAFTFDTDDISGHDSSGDNGILRTFDKATYHLNATYATYDRSSYVTGRIHFAVVLPVPEDKARFDEDSFNAWMNPGYQIIRQDDKTILIGSMDLEPAAGQDSSIPGGLRNLPVAVTVGAMKNGDTFLPEFYAWMDHNDVAAAADENTVNFNTDYQCAAHKDHVFDPDQASNGGRELLQAEVTPLTITAALKLNVKLSMDPVTTHDISPRVFDFSTGSDLALNKNILGDQKVYGRLVAYSLTLQVMGDEARGFIGCELPDPEVGIDVTLGLSSIYTDTNKNVYADPDFQPMIWSYGPNDVLNDDLSWTWENQDGRSGGNAHVITAPYSHLNGLETENAACCFDGGNWVGRSESKNSQYNDLASVATFHVDNFVINWDAFPTKNSDWAKYPTYTTSYVGCFSAGEIWVVQPYKYLNADGTTAKSILDEYGSGTFQLTAEAGDMTAVSVSGQVPRGAGADNTNVDFNNGNQRKKSDDRVVDTFAVSQPGAVSPLIHYGVLQENWCTGDYDVRGAYRADGCFINGKDSLRPGERFAIRGGFQFSHFDIEDNYPVAANSLVKFDGNAIQLYDPKNFDGRAFSQAGADILPGGTAYGMTYNILYGTLPGGRNWANDDELYAAQENDLLWYTSLDQLPEGAVCVAVLQELRGDSSAYMKAHSGQSIMPYFSFNARVAWPTEDYDPTGSVYLLYQNTKVWTKGNLVEAGLPADTPVPSAAEGGNGAALKDFWEKTPHISMAPAYEKARYDMHNNYAGGHLGVTECGDSLFILPYYVTLTKSVDHAEDGEGKLNYDLNKGERTADFVINPQMQVWTTDRPEYIPEVDLAHLTTVTVEDKLPEGLSLLGMPILNGQYDPVSKSVIGGIPCVQDGYVDITEKITVIENNVKVEKEHTFRCKFEVSGDTLIWTIENVPIADYKIFHLPEIHYSCLIGTPGNEETDIAAPTGSVFLKNEAVIYTPEDLRDFSEYNLNIAFAQINVTTYGQTGLSKRAVNPYREIGEPEASYILKYHNNGVNSEDIFMVDALPYDGDFLGSHFFGGYTLSEWKLDLTALGETPIENFALYYTTDTAYRSQIITENDIGDWQKLSIGSDGTVLWKDGAADIVPVAFAVKGNLLGGATIQIALTLLQDTPSPSDLLCNTLSQDGVVVQANIQTMTRSISGLAWHDSNRNGIQDKKVITIPGIPVRLLDEHGDVVVNLNGDICEMVTDENGEYRFTNLPAGKFHVEFSDSDGFLLEDYKFSPYHAPNSRPTNDSDIVEKTDGDALVADIELELPQGAPGGNVSLSHLDGGFYAVTDITATKTWVDFGTGTRPDSIELVLCCNGKQTDKTVTLSASNASAADGNVWTYTFEDLDKYDEDFELYTYSVDEVSVPAGYQKEADGLNITNTLLVSLTVKKITRDWELIPADRKLDQITVVLLEDGKETSRTQVIQLDPATGTGSCTFTLTAQECKDHTYTVKEVIPDAFKDFYTSSVSGQDYDFTVTNTYRKDLEISVEKVTTGWENIPDELKLSSITVNLLRDGVVFDSAEITLDSTGSGTHTFAVKAVDAMGHTFAVEEVIPEAFKDFYTSSVSGQDYNFTITNTPVIQSLSIEVEKVTTGWENIPDELKLSSITVNLLRDGVVVDTAEITLDSTGSGSYTFTVEEMDPDSHTFAVEEVIPEAFKDFYTSSVSGQDYNFTITNTPVIQSLSIEVEKVTTGWENIPDELKLSSITVNLLRDGVVVDTAEITLDSTGSGSYTFTVEEMDPDSHEFTVEEVIPEGFKDFYTSNIEETEDGYLITNTPVIQSLSIEVKKVTTGWENIPDELKLSSIAVNLLRDGVVVDTAEITLDSTGSGSHTFTVEEMDPDSHEFTVEEVIPEAFKDFYTSNIEETEDGYLITNTPVIQSLSIEVKKVTTGWENIPDELKLSSIAVNLLRDGVVVDTAEITLDSTGSGSYTFTVEEMDPDSHEFTVEEVIPEGFKDFYTSSVEETEDGYLITNTPVIQSLSIEVEKVTTGWENIPDELKLSSITVNLLRDGVVVDTAEITLDSTGSGSYTFTVEEMDPDSHTFTVEEVIPEEFKDFYTSSVEETEDGYLITNTPVIQSLSIEVEKVTTGWENIPDELKLSSITVNLLRDGVVVDTAEITLDSTGSGSYTFTVEEMDPDSHTFTVEEVIPEEFKDFYTSSIEATEDGYQITNRPVTGDLIISKIVTGDAGDKDKAFTFEVVFNAPGEFTYTGSHSGTISSGDTITLKHGESITIQGLPIGTEYQVSEKEANKGGYKTTASGEIGIITETTQEAHFVNHKDGDNTGGPGTGDPSSLTLWFALTILSALALAVTLVAVRKQKAGRS